MAEKVTLAEFKEAFNGSGESVMQMAYSAAERLTDDDELVMAAQSAVEAEDQFARMLAERGIFA